MTTITIDPSGSFEMRAADLHTVYDFASRTLTPTLAHYFDDPLNYTDFIGTGLTYDSDGNMIGGTLTDVVSVNGGVTEVTVSGFSIGGAEFDALVRSNDIDGLWDTILAGNDRIIGGGLDDQLLGNRGNDRIFGRAGSDILLGESGNDRLYGEADEDLLLGGLGNDILNGGRQSDYLFGGAGEDSFVFDVKPRTATADYIGDFKPADDTILLDSAIYTEVGAVGPMNPGRFYIGAVAHDATDRIIYNSANGRLFYDPDGTGPDAAIRIATLLIELPMTADDFTII